MITTVDSDQAKEFSMLALRGNQVPVLTSSPGLGKSSIAQQISKEANLKYIDIRLSQCDPVDLNGFPQIDPETGKATYVPFNTFPIEGDTLPKNSKGEEMDGWLIMLDEIHSAPLSVQAAAYKLVLDRMTGQHNLHSRVLIMAAGNLATDNAIVNRLGTAMQSRLVHLELVCNPEKWMTWAIDNDIDYRIKAYINFQPSNLHNFDPNHNDKTFACPRTWEMLSDIIKNIPDIGFKYLPLLAGTVSKGVATEFLTFCDVFTQLPTFDEILKNPTTAKISTEPSVRYAIVGMLTNKTDPSNVAQIMDYIERLPIEFQVILFRDLYKRYPQILDIQRVDKWINTNAQELA